MNNQVKDTYSFCNKFPSYVERDPLAWVVKFSDSNRGFPITLATWCKENCQDAWGWWFDPEYCYVGFENFHDFTWFKLTHSDQISVNT